jgi:hypothetical protein
MPLSRRYSPEKPPGESATFGMDYSFLIPPGVGIAAGSLTIETNVVNPQPAADWIIGPVYVYGRTIYAELGGGTLGQDYRLNWVATDTDGNVWPRTALCLVAQTS